MASSCKVPDLFSAPTVASQGRVSIFTCWVWPGFWQANQRQREKPRGLALGRFGAHRFSGPWTRGTNAAAPNGLLPHSRVKEPPWQRALDSVIRKSRGIVTPCSDMQPKMT